MVWGTVCVKVSVFRTVLNWVLVVVIVVPDSTSNQHLVVNLGRVAELTCDGHGNECRDGGCYH